MHGIRRYRNLCLRYVISDLFEKDPAAEATVARAEGLVGLTTEELTTAIERMGQLVLGIKTLFDTKCDAKSQSVSAYDVPGMLLDLGLSAEAFTKARGYLNSHDITTMDFPKFLELYARYSGLTAPSYSKISAKEGVVPYWVPNCDGLWIEVSIQDTSLPYIFSALVLLVAHVKWHGRSIC
jgi:hypothetical protein